MKIMQGDSYPLYFQILDSDGTIMKDTDVDVVEIMIGAVIKTFPDSVEYDADEKCFVMNLTQQDTFQLSVGSQALQFRVKTKDGNITGWHPGAKLTVLKSGSQAIL